MRINNEKLLRQLLGSKIKTRILEFLTGNNAPVSEREMARIFGVSHTAVNKAMKELLELNIVAATSVGSSLVWQINKKSTAYGVLHAYLYLQKSNTLDIVAHTLHNKIFYLDLFGFAKGKLTHGTNITIGIPSGNFDAYIFGSVIDNTANPESDVDVLFVPKNVDTKKEIERRVGIVNKICTDFAEEIGNKLSIHIHTKEEIETKPALHWAKEVLTNPKKGKKVYP